MKKNLFILLLSTFSLLISMEHPDKQITARQKILHHLVNLGHHEKLEEFCKKGGAIAINQELYDKVQAAAAGEDKTSAQALIAAVITAHSPAHIDKRSPEEQHKARRLSWRGPGAVLTSTYARIDKYCTCPDVSLDKEMPIGSLSDDSITPIGGGMFFKIQVCKKCNHIAQIKYYVRAATVRYNDFYEVEWQS